jgi:hypothetical protein
MLQLRYGVSKRENAEHTGGDDDAPPVDAEQVGFAW